MDTNLTVDELKMIEDAIVICKDKGYTTFVARVHAWIERLIIIATDNDTNEVNG